MVHTGSSFPEYFVFAFHKVTADRLSCTVYECARIIWIYLDISVWIYSDIFQYISEVFRFRPERKRSSLEAYPYNLLIRNMRTCCVSGCSSGNKAPRHEFPKNAERRKKWFENLHMEPLENENEIKKLRVCYRHFCDNDYSGSQTKRVLLHFAVPSVNVPFVNVSQHKSELAENIDCSEYIAQHKQQEQEVLNKQSYIISQEKHEELDTKRETQLQQMQELLTQQQEILTQQQEMLSQQQEILTQQQEMLTQQQEVLTQQQEILTQQQEVLTQQQERILNIEETLKVYAKTRPNLEKVTRQILLSPKARKLYDKIVKMKKTKKQQKRRYEATKQNKSQTIQLRTTNYKENVDATTLG